MLILNYPSKKDLSAAIGTRLSYRETSMFGNEYPADGNGTVVGSNRPSITGNGKREFFASITVTNHLITKVS